MKCSVVVPAAGSGSRFGGDVPKQFVTFAGRPLIAHTLSRLEKSDDVVEIVVAAAPETRQRLEVIRENEALRRVRIVDGGATRSESVLRGLESLNEQDDFVVAIHDAVRPFVTAALLRRLLSAMAEFDGVFPATSPVDTIHMIRHGIVTETPERDALAAAQTPQCFRLGTIRRALAQSIAEGRTVTDEVAAVVRIGARVAAIEGEPDNFKITLPEDLDRAERLLVKLGE